MLPEAAAFKKDWQLAQKDLRKSGEDCSFVYLQIREDNDDPMYVGIGQSEGRPWYVGSARTLHHRNSAKKHGVRVQIVSDKLDFEVSKFWEVRLIKALRSFGCNLLNSTDGGDGTTGYRRSDEEKELFRQINNRPEIKEAHSVRMTENNPMKNPETAKAVGEMNRGRKASEETKNKQRKSVWSKPNHWSNVLTPEQAYDIGTLALSRGMIAKQFAISSSTVGRIQKYIAEIIGVPPRHIYPKIKKVKPAKQKYTSEMRSCVSKEVASRPSVKEKQRKTRLLLWEDADYSQSVSEGVSLTWENDEVRSSRLRGMTLAWEARSEEEKHDNAIRGWETRRKKIAEMGGTYVHPNSRKVVEITDGITFDSIKKAAEFYGLKEGNISAVCAGRQQTTGGRRFKFAEEA